MIIHMDLRFTVDADSEEAAEAAIHSLHWTHPATRVEILDINIDNVVGIPE